MAVRPSPHSGCASKYCMSTTTSALFSGDMASGGGPAKTSRNGFSSTFVMSRTSSDSIPFRSSGREGAGRVFNHHDADVGVIDAKIAQPRNETVEDVAIAAAAAVA